MYRMCLNSCTMYTKAVTYRLTAPSKGDRRRETDTNKMWHGSFFPSIFRGNFLNFFVRIPLTRRLICVLCHSFFRLINGRSDPFCWSSHSNMHCAKRARIINVTTKNPLHRCYSTCCCAQNFTHNIPHRRENHGEHIQTVFILVVLQIFGVRSATAKFEWLTFFRQNHFSLSFYSTLHIRCSFIKICEYDFFLFAKQINNLINHRFSADAWRAHFSGCITTPLFCVDCSQCGDISFFWWPPLKAGCCVFDRHYSFNRIFNLKFLLNKIPIIYSYCIWNENKWEKINI